MKNLFKQVRLWIKKYPKMFLHPLYHAMTIALLFSWFPALYRYLKIKGGEYPGQPVEVIRSQLDIMLPEIITGAVITFLLLILIIYIPLLIFHAKRFYNISLPKEFWRL